MKELFNLIIEKMDALNTIIAFTSSFTGWFFWYKNKKKQARRDIIFIVVSTIMAVIIPVLFLIRAYRATTLNWLDWVCIVISCCFIFAYFFNLFLFTSIKKKMDKDFKGLKMFDND